MTRRLGIGDIRAEERARAKHLNDTQVYLDNPDASPTFSKGRSISSEHKALAFGMEPTSPKALIDLPRGDAGSGQSAYRRIHAFFSLAGESPGIVGGTAFTQALPIITMRSENQRAKYWHVSIYGVGVRRFATVGPQLPLTDAEILSLQFEEYFVESPAGTAVPISPRFVPSIPSAQARVMVHDESGQRFFDVDVLGNRSFSVYGFGVTVFLLVKTGGYEVDAQNPGANAALDGNSVGVEDDIIGARVLGIFTNRTESVENRTLSIRIDPTNFGGAPLERIVPVPPGARRVQIFSDTPLPGPLWEVEFWYGRGLSGARPDVGIIDFNALQSRTSIIDIPNAPSISFRPLNPAVTPTTVFTLVFEVEP